METMKEAAKTWKFDGAYDPETEEMVLRATSRKGTAKYIFIWYEGIFAELYCKKYRKSHVYDMMMPLEMEEAFEKLVPASLKQAFYVMQEIALLPE